MKAYEQIYIQKIDTSVKKDMYLLVHNERYFEASHDLVELLVCLQNEDTLKEAIELYLSKKEGRYTYTQVEQLIMSHVFPIFNEETIGKPKKIFIYNKELFSSKTIDHFSDIFRFLFHKACVLTIIIVALVLNGYFFYSTKDLLTFNNMANLYVIVSLLFFIVLSSLFHELGHASACKYFGIRHGGIGFGLYLNFPVLYTDVTAVWRLDRKKRCIVNIAGVYFQLYILLALLTVYWLTHADIVRYMILTVNLGFIMTLNPFFKFDGYWMASDMLGVPNLRQRSWEWIVYLYKRIRKIPVNEKPYLLSVSKMSKCGLLIYSIVVNIFMGYYFFYILPKFLYRFIQSFPGEVRQLVLYLSNGIAPSFALLHSIVTQLLVLFLMGIFVNSFFRSFIHAKRK